MCYNGSYWGNKVNLTAENNDLVIYSWPGWVKKLLQQHIYIPGRYMKCKCILNLNRFYLELIFYDLFAGPW